MPLDRGDLEDPDDDVPAHVVYVERFREVMTIDAAFPLTASDLAALVSGVTVTLDLGEERPLEVTLDAAAIAARRHVSRGTDFGEFGEYAASGETRISWTDSVIRVFKTSRYRGDGRDFEIPFSPDYSESGLFHRSLEVKFAIGAVTGSRTIAGLTKSRATTLTRRLSDPEIPGETVTEEYELFSFAGAAAADYTPPAIRFLSPAANAVAVLPSVVVWVWSDLSAESVAVSVNGGGWISAERQRRTSAGSLWAVEAPLAPGANLIEATASDIESNAMTPISRQMRCTPLRGNFLAALRDAAGEVRGRMELAINPLGAVTGKLFAGTQTMALRGTVDAAGVLTLEVVGGAATVQAALVAEDATMPTTLTGAATIGGVAYAIAGRHAPFDGRTHSFAGNIARGTMTLDPVYDSEDFPLPDALFGTGFAVFTAPHTGVVRIAGRLPDATAFTYGSRVDAEGKVAVFRPLYRKPGAIVGELGIEEGAFSGGLLWTKPAQNDGSRHTQGIAAEVDVTGWPYVPGPHRWLSEFGLVVDPSTGFREGELSLSSSTVDITRDVTFANSGVARVDENRERIAVSVVNATGLVTGSFMAGTQRRTIAGVVMQDSHCAGLFAEPGEIGSFYILATGGYTGGVSVGGSTAFVGPFLPLSDR